MTKRQVVARGGVSRKGKDKFALDEKRDEYEKPGPTVDPDFAGIERGLSKLNGREKTGLVIRWRPKWLQKLGLPAFGAFFFEDKLAVDLFNRVEGGIVRKNSQTGALEMDALEDDLTDAQRQEVMKKIDACRERGIAYIHLGPDDELDLLTLAAKTGKVSRKKVDEAPDQGETE